MSRTVTVVLGGGRGTRLRPLTDVRAKPAVPLGGKYRLIDIPISNAINSGLRHIFVLTQFNSASLNAHLTKTYRFDPFSNGWVEVLAAEQTNKSGDWYQGTADAVRQQFHHLDRRGVSDVLILSGDHLYRMDYRDLLRRHQEANADITVSAIPVLREHAHQFGVIRVCPEGMITGFHEKPKSPEALDALALPWELRERWGIHDGVVLASMGIYVFKLDVLRDLLADPKHIDFGSDILPKAIGTHRVAAYQFQGYWEDVGTIASFYRANLQLCHDDTPFRLYHPDAPIYTRPRFLPPTIIAGAKVEHAVIGEGCMLSGSEITRSVIGLRSVVQPGTRIVDSILLGADHYETEPGPIPMGIGAGTSIRRAIIDKNVKIGEGCVIHGAEGRPDEEHEDYMVSDGIVIVRKGAVFPAGTVL